jgi:pimeloyl-ACP methyl ester carboxylesterase
MARRALSRRAVSRFELAVPDVLGSPCWQASASKLRAQSGSRAGNRRQAEAMADRGSRRPMTPEVESRTGRCRRNAGRRSGIGFFAQAVVLATVGLFAKNPAQADDCAGLERRPVLFVHGSGLAPDSWAQMTARFRARGYPASHLVAVRLRPDDGSNPRAAERFILPAVHSLLANARRQAQRARCRPPEKVDIIAHSMGAVSARWYIAKLDATKVRNLVGIAPAHHGSDALCGLPGDGNRELCPAFAGSNQESAVQYALNGSTTRPIDETPHGFGADSDGRPRIPPTPGAGVAYWTIRLDPDEWIRPASSAVLDGAGGRALPPLPPGARETSPGNVLWPSGVRHDDLPRTAELIDFVGSLLSADP